MVGILIVLLVILIIFVGWVISSALKKQLPTEDGANFDIFELAKTLQEDDELLVLVRVSEREGRWTSYVIGKESEVDIRQRLSAFSDIVVKFHIIKKEQDDESTVN
jgi:Na+-transporting methylmalonyl-CoA/oxaloacetate decarboxylase gamma subunit